MPTTIVLATPHQRNDHLVSFLTNSLPDSTVVRISTKDDLTLDNLNKIKPNWIFFPHWSWKVPESILANFECVIFHMTDLPFGRGGSPLQNLILRGHGDTKLTALKCVKELDAGPIYSKIPLSLAGTAEEILQRASKLMGNLILNIVQNNLVPTPQSGEIVDFKRRRPEDGDIYALKSVEKVYDYIRMLDATGYPPAFIKSESLIFEFSQAEFCGDVVEAKVRIRRQDSE